MPGSTVTSVYTNPLSPLLFDNLASTAFNVAGQTINLGTTHNFSTGDLIYFFGNVSGLTNNSRYFVIVVDTTTIKLASTLANAQAGTNVTFGGASSGNFRKILSYNASDFRNIFLYPCYAKSSITFNSSTPVQVDISYPPYQSIYDTYVSGNALITFALVHLCGFRNPINNNSWYFGLGSTSYQYFQVYSGTTGSTLNSTLGSVAPTAGWKQRYVITTNRTIQYWAWTGSTPPSTPFYTTPALAANTSLNLEFGANFNNLSINDCTIKYL